MLHNSLKNRLLIPWYILVFSLIILSIIRLNFISKSNANLEHSTLHKKTMITSYRLKVLHDNIFINILTNYRKEELLPYLLDESKKINDLYTELLITLEEMSNFHDHESHKLDRQHYETYKTLNTEILSLYNRYILDMNNDNLIGLELLQELINEKNILIRATLDDIIIINEIQEEVSFLTTFNRLIAGFIHQSGSIFLVVIITILLTIYQFRTISKPANMILKQLDAVERGERGNFKQISNIYEIKSIAEAIDKMITSLVDSHNVISFQNRNLTNKLAELRVVKRTLRLTQKRARLGSWTWFPYKGFTFSHLTQKIFHINKSTMNSNEILHLLPEYSRQFLINEVFKQIRTNRKISIDLEFNSNMWVCVTGVLSYTTEGKIICIHGTLQDITERVTREWERDELNLAIKQSSDSILITDVDAKIIFVNDTFVKSSGFTRDELIGNTPKILASGKTPDITYKNMWDTIHRGDTWKGIFYNRRRDGEEYTEFCSITPLKKADGSLHRFIGVKENISMQNLKEEDFERYWKKMEVLVEERTEELVKALDKAEESSKAKEIFIANMSHEIRTPMNAILGMTNLMKETQLNNKQAGYINNISISSNLLLNIINDILDYSKVEAGMMTLAPETIDLPIMLNDIYYMLKNQAENKSLYFNIINNTDIRGIYIDSLRLTQALVNLLNNAIKFTEYGGVALVIDTIRDYKNGAELLFTIEDTGKGISDDLRSKLFTPYKQGNDSYTRKQGGSGLGLVITQRIIKLFGGDMGFSSVMGKGSSFWFSFSCQKREILTIDHKIYNKNKIYEKLYSLKPLSILIADDDEINQQVLIGLFEDKNISIDIVTNGIEVVKRFEEKKDYDLILMDMQMPEMDGLEASVKIRERNPLIPIIALTANAYDKDRSRCYNAGMTDFLTKPYSPIIIYNTIYKWIKEYRRDCEFILMERVNTLFGKNLETYLSLTTMFFQDYGTINTDEMGRELVHKLKGSASNMGFNKVFSLCQSSLDDMENIELKKEIIESISNSQDIVKKMQRFIIQREPIEKLMLLLLVNNTESISFFQKNCNHFRKKMNINDYFQLDKSIKERNYIKCRRICSGYLSKDTDVSISTNL